MIEKGLEGWLINSPVVLKAVTSPTYVKDGTIKFYCKETAGITYFCFMGDDGVEVCSTAAGFASTHNLLSATHTDSLAGSVVRGDLVVGNSTPKWSRFAKGASGTVLQMGASDPAWTAPSNVTAASTKITLAGTPTAATLQAFSIDVNQANLDHGSIGGLSDDDHTQYVLHSILTTRGDIFTRGASTTGRLAVGGSAGMFLRSDGTDPGWSTLKLPNAATANYIAYASATNTYGESANLTFDGTDFLIGSGIRARMAAQNRFRHLNTMAQAVSSGATNITNNTYTSLALAAEGVDTDTAHDTVTNNSRLTCQLTGKYIVLGSTDITANAAGTTIVRILKNGTTVVAVGNQIINQGTVHNGLVCLGLIALTAADYIELQGYQNSGGTLTNHNTNSSYLAMIYVGE